TLASENPTSCPDSRATSSTSTPNPRLVSSLRPARSRSTPRPSRPRFGIPRVRRDTEPSLVR
ncbi:hypothetical protein HDU98_003428, partial [Podochytrium sp. JEL0797]